MTGLFKLSSVLLIIGGDEFMLLLNNIEDPSFIKNTFERIYTAIASQVIIEYEKGGKKEFEVIELPVEKEQEYFASHPEQHLHRRLSISMGVRTFKPGEQNFPTLESALKQTDVGATFTKEHGRGGICFIDEIDDVEGKMRGHFHKYTDGAFTVSERQEIRRDVQRENSEENLMEKIIGALERIMSCVYRKHDKRTPAIDNAIGNLAKEIRDVCRN